MKKESMILFVCTGNTCRSYMAETIARAYIESLASVPNIKISSAGTGCYPGEPASTHARQVMAERGYANEEHQASPLTIEAIKEADLILTMTRLHREYVIRLVPEAEGKVFLLTEYAMLPVTEGITGKDTEQSEKVTEKAGKQSGKAAEQRVEQGTAIITEITDPFGGDIDVYRACAGQLADLIPRVIDKYLSEGK